MYLGIAGGGGYTLIVCIFALLPRLGYNSQMPHQAKLGEALGQPGQPQARPAEAKQVYEMYLGMSWGGGGSTLIVCIRALLPLLGYNL